jgi:hypothetical protein
MTALSMLPEVVAAEEWAPAPAVVLSLAATPVERSVVEAYARQAAVDVTVTGDGETALAAATADGERIVPVGIAWLPPAREGGRRFAVRDLRALTDPSRPRGAPRRAS